MLANGVVLRKKNDKLRSRVSDSGSVRVSRVMVMVRMAKIMVRA